MEDNNALNDMVDVMMTVEAKKKKMSFKKWIVIGLVIVIIVAAVSFITVQVLGNQEKKAEILTTATLEKMVKISELSTFQAVYNGIAKVINQENPDQVDYYVTYMAKVNAGFDFEKVKVTLDNEVKKITVSIPEIGFIGEPVVDIGTLDYIFLNDKAETNTITAQAYPACIADAKKESEEESAIKDLAKQNAKNIMEALINPFIENLDTVYELDIIFGGVS